MEPLTRHTLHTSRGGRKFLRSFHSTRRKILSAAVLSVFILHFFAQSGECFKINEIPLCGLCGTETFACGSNMQFIVESGEMLASSLGSPTDDVEEEATDANLNTAASSNNYLDVSSQIRPGGGSPNETSFSSHFKLSSINLTAAVTSGAINNNNNKSPTSSSNYLMNLNDKLQKALIEIQISSAHPQSTADHGVNNNCTCIPLSWRCDGAPDCPDASDEIGCDKMRCPTKSEFSCSTNSICIDKALYCNGVNDCGDNSDESDCSPRECDIEHETRCDNGRCIPSEWLCDEHDDCGDQSDERCRKPCDGNEFQCQSGECIAVHLYCNNHTDCADRSDELECSSSPTVKSSFIYPAIVDSSQIACPASQMMCNNGLCVSESYQCDGDNDCGDWSDENICDGRVKCRVTEYQCSSGQCINSDWRCDGDYDCDDRSDELNCPSQLCSKDEFRCRTGRCIRSSWRCDGDKDCEDNSDEESCAHRTECTIGNFRCRDSTCVSLASVCNGAPNCPDGSDEDTNSTCIANVIPCQENGFPCQHLCVATSNGHYCACKDGYRKGLDGRSCIDINECIIGNLKSEHFDYLNGNLDVQKSQYSSQSNIQVCSQMCENSVPGYQCSCLKGYRLRADKRRCKAVQGPEAILLVSNINDISGLILDSSLLLSQMTEPNTVSLDLNEMTNHVQALERYQRQLIYLDYLYTKNLLFWIDLHTKQIYSALLELNPKKLIITSNSQQLPKLLNLKLNRTQPIIRSGLVSPNGLAVDWINERVYWSDSGASRIEYANLDGSLRKVLFSFNIELPNSIVVHPEQSTIYWSDWGEPPRIESSFMDGTARRAIVTSLLSMPTSLVIDFPASKLYWTDVKLRMIECVNLDGSNRYTIVSEQSLHPISLAIFEDNLYWTNLGSKHINTISKLTGKNVTILNIDDDDIRRSQFNNSTDQQQVYSFQVKVFHSLRQVEVEKRHCQEHHCSHICLPNNASYQCTCPYGFSFEDNSREKCSDESNPLLLFTHRSDIRALTISKSRTAVIESDVLYNDYNIDYVLPIPSIAFLVSFDYDLQTSYVYWTDLFNKSIGRAKWTGRESETIIDTTLEAPSAIAFDWAAENLYWTDTSRNVIEVATSDGLFRSIIVWQLLDQPRDIVVDPSTSLMFWSQWSNQSANIERAGMDGSNRAVLHINNMTRPHGLALDAANRMIYWTDSGKSVIEYSFYDGSNRRVLISRSMRHPFAVTIFGEYVYWSDLQTRNIQQAHKLTGDLRSIILEEIDNLMDLAVLQYNASSYNNQYHPQHGSLRRLQSNCEKAKCSQLCLLSPTSPGYRCACSTGIRLMSDGVSCAIDMDKYLIITSRRAIRRISLDTEYHIDVNIPLNQKLSNALILDVHTDDNFVFWSDTKENAIYKADIVEGRVEPVVAFGLFDVNGLAIDNIGHKIYWTDAGRKRIEVANLDGSYRRVLINTDIDSPRAIAVNHPSGHMIWSDWGEQVRIERADMDGTRRAILVSKDLGWPNGITITKNGRIIWADSKIHTIEMVDMNGANRKKIVENLPSPYGVTMIDDHLYWTDWQSKSIYRIRFNSNLDLDANWSPKVELFIKTMSNLVDVRAIDRLAGIMGNTMPQHNMCQINNGGCSHLCLRNSAKGYSCLCPTGMQLLVDNRTCLVNIDKQILIASATNLRRISLETNDMTDTFLPLNDLIDIVSIDYHFTRGQIFYVDANQKVIKSLTLINKNLSEIGTATRYGIQTIVPNDLGNPTGVAIDWIANNIYWCDQERHRIEVARIDGSSRKVLIDLDLDQPRSLGLLANHGFIFWINSGVNQRIERAYLDGSGRTVLVETDISHLQALTVDNGVETFDNVSRLYWSDSGLKRIESVLTDGTYRQVVISKGLSMPFSIAVLDDYIYWVDLENEVIERANRWTGDNYELVLDNVKHLRDLKIVTALRQETVPIGDSDSKHNPCGVYNGGCSNLCLFRPHGYICSCPSQVETITCSTVPGEIVGNVGKKVSDLQSPRLITKQQQFDSMVPSLPETTPTMDPLSIDFVPKPTINDKKSNHSLLKEVDASCRYLYNSTKCQPSLFFPFDNEHFTNLAYVFALILLSIVVLICVVLTFICRRKIMEEEVKISAKTANRENGNNISCSNYSNKIVESNNIDIDYLPTPPPPPRQIGLNDQLCQMEYLQPSFGYFEAMQPNGKNSYVQTLQRYPAHNKAYIVENGDYSATIQTLKPRCTGSGLDDHIITTLTTPTLHRLDRSPIKLTGSIQNVHSSFTNHNINHRPLTRNGSQRETDI